MNEITRREHIRAARQDHFRAVWQAARQRRIHQLQVGLAITLIILACICAAGLFAGPALWLIGAR